MAKLFLAEIYRLYRLPKIIVSDRDPTFTSQFWQHLFKVMGTKLTMSTSYHPQIDGQTERLNRCLETYLRAMVLNEPRRWVKWLPLAEWWYNSNHHSALNTAPFQALYGYNPSQIPMGYLPHYTPTTVGIKLAERQQFLQNLKET